MKSWVYWDHDYSSFAKLFELHKASAGINALEGGAIAGLDDPLIRKTSLGATSRDRGDGSQLDVRLRAIGMLAEPCVTRQSRAERMQSRRAAPPKEAPRAPRGGPAAPTASWPPPLPSEHTAEGGHMRVDAAAARRVVSHALGGRGSHSPRGVPGRRQPSGRGRVVGMRAGGSMSRSTAPAARKPRLNSGYDEDEEAAWEDDWYDADADGMVAGHGAPATVLSDFWDDALRDPTRSSVHHPPPPMRTQPRSFLQDDEDADLQRALALSAAEAQSAAAASPPPVQAILSTIEERLDAQRRRYQQEHQQQLPSSGRGTEHVSGAHAVDAEDLWGGELSEDDAFALAIRLSTDEEEARRAGLPNADDLDLDAFLDEEENYDGVYEEVTPPSHPPGLPPGLRTPVIAVPDYTDDDFVACDDDEHSWASSTAPVPPPPGLGIASHHPPGLDAATTMPRLPSTPLDWDALHAWALGELERVLTADAPVDAAVLLEYVLACEGDDELIEYAEAFIGASGLDFAIELCERRRRVVHVVGVS